MATEATKEDVKTEDAPKEEKAEAPKEDSPKEEKPVEIYDESLPNRIIVGRNHPLSFYVDRARRVFRIEDTVSITGRGDNISTVCKLVETLKKQKIATIEKISTGMNVQPYFNSYGDAKWGQPTAVILFKLKRGEFGEFISDYQQRKVIEIFENCDEKSEGTLQSSKVEELEMGKKFKAKTEQLEKAKKFIADNVKDGTMDLPMFIKYASILIDPLLKNGVFKDVLRTEFNIEVSGGNRDKDKGEDKADKDS